MDEEKEKEGGDRRRISSFSTSFAGFIFKLKIWNICFKNRSCSRILKMRTFGLKMRTFDLKKCGLVLRVSPPANGKILTFCTHMLPMINETFRKMHIARCWNLRDFNRIFFLRQQYKLDIWICSHPKPSFNCHFWWEITKMITRVTSRIFSDSSYIWFSRFSWKLPFR